jgi:hypothetical protein
VVVVAVSFSDMGLELSGRVRFAPKGAPEQSGTCKVLIETDALILRGDVRASVSRDAITGVTVRNGTVHVFSRRGTISIVLGNSAEKFAAKLREPPKTRLEKIGIGTESRVVVNGLSDASFRDETAAVGATAVTRAGKDESLIVIGVDTATELTKIAAAAKSLAPSGALWVVHPKGATGVKDTDIFAAGKNAGLTYVKVARFSETHTAEKLVIPKAERAT